MLPTKTPSPWIESLKPGNELPNAEIWKTRQKWINLLCAVVIAMLQLSKLVGMDIPYTNEELTNAGSIIALLFFNVWVTVATTKRIGL